MEGRAHLESKQEFKKREGRYVEVEDLGGKIIKIHIKKVYLEQKRYDYKRTIVPDCTFLDDKGYSYFFESLFSNPLKYSYKIDLYEKGKCIVFDCSKETYISQKIIRDRLDLGAPYLQTLERYLEKNTR